jgi:hypothetical protein
VLVALLTLALFLAVLPAMASAATTAKVRIDNPFSTLFGPSSVSLSAAPVAPIGAPDGQTCAADSALGAIHAAVGGNWYGTWSDNGGWSLTGFAAPAPAGTRWVVFVNGLVVQQPCTKILEDDNSYVRAYPMCTDPTSTSASCLTRGHLDLRAPAIGGIRNPTALEVFQTIVTFDDQGNILTLTGPSTHTRVDGPGGFTLTDDYFGTAALAFTQKGDNTVYTSKNGFVADTAKICVTDGADGYCGTQVPPQTVFEPNNFCQSTGFDGFCGNPDQVAPAAKIIDPVQAKAYPSAGGPTAITGTADFDPSGVKQINLRALRQLTVIKTRFKKKKVTVKKKVRGKVVRKRVTKRVKYKVRVKACYGLTIKGSAASWKALSKCDSALAPTFAAAGGDSWTTELPIALPNGAYTLDALAQDGAGNIDGAVELGRNRVTFTVR